MDPVSVFRALYDSKCLKFGQQDLKSSKMAPHSIDLSLLSLHPRLMDAVIDQVIDRFLSPQALNAVMTQLRKREQHQHQHQHQHQDFGAVEQQDQKSLLHAKASSTFSQESDVDSHLEEDEIEAGESEEECEERSASPSSFRPIISGSVPLAAAVAYKAQLPFMLERRAANEQHSLVDHFESDAEHDEASSLGQQHSVVLVEEVICSGEKTLETVRSFEKLGLKVEFVICIIDREENGVNLLLAQHGIKVFSLYNIVAILRVLEATGRISAEQFIGTRQWITSNQLKNMEFPNSALVGPRKTCIAQQDSTKSPRQNPEIEVLSN